MKSLKSQGASVKLETYPEIRLKSFQKDGKAKILSKQRFEKKSNSVKAFHPMELATDIAVIGNGLAAYAAAIALQNSGRDITVVAKAPGATALSSGAWDIADHPLRRTSDPWSDACSIETNLREILRHCEFHPYTVLSPGADAKALQHRLCSEIRTCAQLPGLAMVGNGQENQFIPTDMGNLKAAAWVQSSMREADMHRWHNTRVLAVGIRGFVPFNARFLRHAWLEVQSRQPKSPIEFAGDFEVPLDDLPSQSSLTATELAQRLDQERVFVKFGQEIVRYISKKVYTHLLLPPVLGIENTLQIVEALRQITGLAVAETLASPMSIPGFRLHRAIQKFFELQNIPQLTGDIIGFDSEQRKIKTLRIHQGNQRLRLKIRTVILASGKYLSGGLARQQKFIEPIFHLPLFFENQLLGEKSVMRLSHPWPQTQDFFSAGIRINGRSQALDSQQSIAYDNLFAAGSVLAGFDPTRSACAAGVSILSGMAAARHSLSLS